MSGTTVIRNASWIIAWDGARHIYLRDGDVAFADGALTQVGGRFEGPAATEIDGRGLMAMPGLIDIHAHLATEPVNKGFRDEIRSPAFWHSPLYEHLYMIEVDAAGAIATIQVAIGELLLSGVTTASYLGQVYLGIDSDALYDVLGHTGMRVYVGPMFRDARWITRGGHAVEYAWDTDAGARDFERAKHAIERARRHPSGRLHGMVCPAQVDTCTPELMRAAFDYAEANDLPIQIHLGQTPTEFHEMIRRTGRTPLGALAAMGALAPRTILGHAIFLDHHPWLHWPAPRDLGLLAESGASVAHCPVEFLRRGMALHTLGGYLRRGVNIGLGTDTYPHNLLEEARMAAYAARIIAETVEDVITADVFDAATVGGARARGRDDIGRLAPGCRADLVLVDLKHPAMMPAREPLRSLIYVAAERAVRDVFVEGEPLVRAGKLVRIDLPAMLDEVEALQRRGSSGVAARDWAGRDIDALAPMALPVAGG